MENRIKTKGIFQRTISGLSQIKNLEGVKSEFMILEEVYWYIECERDDNRLTFFFSCIPTIAEDIEGAVIADISVRIKSQKPGIKDIVKDHLKPCTSVFASGDSSVEFYKIYTDDVNTRNAYIIDDRIEFEASIEVTNIAFMGCFGIDFLNPTKNSDAVLVVEDEEQEVKELHVNKKFLATHSSYFAKMFKDGGTNDEFEMASDAKFVDICELMRFVYSDSGLIIDWGMMDMLNLADKYDFQEVMHVIAEHAISIDDKFDYSTFPAFKIADKYKLTDLHSHLLKSFSKEQIRSISTHDAFDTLSIESKYAIAKIINSWKTPDNLSKQLQSFSNDELIPASNKSKEDASILRQGTFITTLMPSAKLGQFYIGNIPWTVEVEEKSDEELKNNYFEMDLSCNTGNVSPFWSVRAHLTVRIVCQSEEEDDLMQTGQFFFDSTHGKCKIRFGPIDRCARFTTENGIKTEISIGMMKVVGIGSYGIDFSNPTDLSDVVLIVEGKNIHVCKEFLSMHSSVFEVMFSSGFKEKNQEEIELKDIEYELFVDMLTLIYPSSGVPIHEKNVESLLQIADFYDIQKVRDKCLNFLMKTKEMSDCKKFEIIDKYRLDKNKFLMSWTKEDFERLADSDDLENISADSHSKLIKTLLKFSYFK